MEDAAWVAENVCPAIVTVPDSPLVLVLAATDRPTLPLPEPVVPEVTVIHEVLLKEDQPHPALAVTETAAVPPVALKVWLAGEIE